MKHWTREEVTKMLEAKNTPEARFCLAHRRHWTAERKAAWLVEYSKGGK